MTDTTLYSFPSESINDDNDYLDADYLLSIGAKSRGNGIWSLGEDTAPEPEPNVKQSETSDLSVAEHGVTNINNDEWQRELKSAGHKLLYMALIHWCGSKNLCVVGHETLAQECSSSTASIERWLRDLMKIKLVEIVPHQYKNCNCYKLPKHTPVNLTKSKMFWDKKRGKKVSSQ